MQLRSEVAEVTGGEQAQAQAQGGVQELLRTGSHLRRESVG